MAKYYKIFFLGGYFYKIKKGPLQGLSPCVDNVKKGGGINSNVFMYIITIKIFFAYPNSFLYSRLVCWSWHIVGQ